MFMKKDFQLEALFEGQNPRFGGEGGIRTRVGLPKLISSPVSAVEHISNSSKFVEYIIL